MATATATAKVSVETKELARCVNLASKCINSKPIVQILGDILLTYEPEKGFVMSASNTELWIDIPVKMNLMSGEFKNVCINYAMLKKAVATLPQESTLELSFMDDQRLKVDYRKGKFSVLTEDASDYPVSTDFLEAENAPTCKFRVHDGWLVENLRNAKGCAAEDKVRPNLASVCIDVFKDSLTVVSTDAHTLFYNNAKLQEEDLICADFETNAQLMLSQAAIDAVCSTFGYEEVIVTSDCARASFMSETTGIKLMARLTEGKYVPYERLITYENDKILKVELNDILGAIKRCNVFANQVNHLAALTNEDNDVSISVNNIDLGMDSDEVVKKLDGSVLDGEFKIGFNIERFNQMLGILSTENIVMSMSGPTKPIILGNDDEESKLILLIMPMSI